MRKIIVVLFLFLFAHITYAEKKPYEVIDGKVDKNTYNGYRRFHGTCHVCHGKDALGSTIAPNLAESLKQLSYEDFINTITNGRVNKVAGQIRVMPGFKDNKDIMKYRDDIYSYLKAISDGVLSPGRPQKIKKK